MPAADEAQQMLPNAQAPFTDTFMPKASFAGLAKELRQKILSDVFDDIFNKIGPTVSENVIASELRAVLSISRSTSMDSAQPLRMLYASLTERQSVLVGEIGRCGGLAKAEKNKTMEDVREAMLSKSLELYDDLMVVQLSLKILKPVMNVAETMLQRHDH